nr:MAG TPA: hypothetical protein [Caudoviricetes sp.]
MNKEFGTYRACRAVSRCSIQFWNIRRRMV